MSHILPIVYFRNSLYIVIFYNEWQIIFSEASRRVKYSSAEVTISHRTYRKHLYYHSCNFTRWGCGNSNRVYCLHGWLDNSDSFSKLGPYLASRGFEVTACDHLGHGLSSHATGSQPFTDYVQHTREILLQLGMENNVNLIGHSMGTAISMMYAGSYPEQVLSFVCIDGFGPTGKAPADAAKVLRWDFV